MKKTVFITIGQAPRNDIAMIYNSYFGQRKDVSQIGLLDGLTLYEAQRQFGKDNDEETLVSRMQDGCFIEMAHEKVEMGLQKIIKRLENQSVTTIVILCTAEFGQLTTEHARLIEPEKVIIPFISEKYQYQTIGLFIPLAEQLSEANEKWKNKEGGIHFVVGSPYTFDETIFMKAISELNKNKVDVILLDCMGYNATNKTFVESNTDCPVLLSNEILFEYVENIIRE